MKSFGDVLASQGADAEKRIQQRDFNYEATVVKFLLKRFNLAWKQRDLENACLEATGHGHLTLAWFQAAYPTFPAWLAVRRLPHVSEMTIADWHDVQEKDGKIKDRFFNSPIFKAYAEVLESYSASSQVVGMVFPCRQVVHYIIHNGDVSVSLPGSRLCKTQVRGGPICVIEPLRQYLEEMAERWQV